MMNCKPGDLAVFVKSTAGNEGKIVRCLVLHPPGYDFFNKSFGPVWETDNHDLNFYRFFLGRIDGKSNYACDSQLRPIRPDETPEESAEAMNNLHHIFNKEIA